MDATAKRTSITVLVAITCLLLSCFFTGGATAMAVDEGLAATSGNGLATQAIESVEIQKENLIEVTGKTVVVKPSKMVTLKRKQVLVVIGAKGEVTYAKRSGNDNIEVAKNGTITVKKGTTPGTYTVKVDVTAAGTKLYKSKTVTATIKVVVPKVNPVSVKTKAVTVKSGVETSLKRAKVFVVSKAKGQVAYAKKAGNTKIAIAKNGVITVKKGLAPGTYRMKVAVKAQGNSRFVSKTVTVTVKITVKV